MSDPGKVMSHQHKQVKDKVLEKLEAGLGCNTISQASNLAFKEQ